MISCITMSENNSYETAPIPPHLQGTKRVEIIRHENGYGVYVFGPGIFPDEEIDQTVANTPGDKIGGFRNLNDKAADLMSVSLNKRCSHTLATREQLLVLLSLESES